LQSNIVKKFLSSKNESTIGVCENFDPIYGLV